jgi:drug/metabolite transporter (DMT)-like permease
MAVASMRETLRVAEEEAPGVLTAPPPGDVALMVLAIAAVSTSGPIIAATAAPALAIAFWRNAMASGLLVPWTLARHRDELTGLRPRERRLAVFAGVLLAGHFATWVPSLSYTSVSSATALVSTQPIWAALLARRTGHVIPRRAWLGIAVAVAGAALVTGVDVNVSPRALAGDLLALVGGFFGAAYMVAGGEVRRNVSTSTYTTVCYLTTSIVLLLVCFIGRQPLVGYSGNAWIKLVALTLGAQFLGHSLFNRVLRTTSATVVSLSMLFEVVGASLLAAFWLHQHPHAAAIPGLLLIVAGAGAVISTRDRAVAPALPVE